MRNRRSRAFFEIDKSWLHLEIVQEKNITIFRGVINLIVEFLEYDMEKYPRNAITQELRQNTSINKNKSFHVYNESAIVPSDFTIYDLHW